VDNSSQLDIFLDNTLNYQISPPAGFGNKVFFMGFDLDSSTRSEQCKISIKNSYLPSWAVLAQEYDSETGKHKGHVVGYLNDGQNLINHSDHCNETVMGVGSYRHGERIDKSTFAALFNGDEQGLM